ncbi:DUF7848 domain-containing protein [Streptomyces clavuligerus]|nr:hypothetical protein [Streptomyces clavuligerus]WDN50796.1 hypothetical protein LL058_02415 [Streptomyces clavuligerus]
MTIVNSQGAEPEPAAADRGATLVPVTGAPTTRVVECADCEGRSPLGPPGADVAGWALGHAAVTGHHTFQQVTTELLHAGPGGAGVL